MVEDLVSEHLRVEMPMKDVRVLLGRPDQMTGDGVWFYNVSAEYGGFLPTCVGLELAAAKGRLTRAIVTRDD